MAAFKCIDKIKRVSKQCSGRREDGIRFLQVFLGCMCRTSIGHGTDAGTSRTAHGVVEEKLLQAAAEYLYERMGSSKGMDWCINILQKSFMRRKYY